LRDRSPLRRFVMAYRDFGLVVAMRVAYSKVRGKLNPAMALPDAPVYSAGRREVSVLLSTAQHGAATLDAVIEGLARRGGADWEICICERIPAEPETAHSLARHRGTQPWIRILTTDRSVDDASAARWTVEQATGLFVALAAPGYTPAPEAIAGLLARLRNDPALDTVALVGTARGSEAPPSPADCHLLLQRKSCYLAVQQGQWHLSAAALARYLDEAGVPIAYTEAAPGHPLRMISENAENS